MEELNKNFTITKEDIEKFCQIYCQFCNIENSNQILQETANNTNNLSNKTYYYYNFENFEIPQEFIKENYLEKGNNYIIYDYPIEFYEQNLLLNFEKIIEDFENYSNKILDLQTIKEYIWINLKEYFHKKFLFDNIFNAINLIKNSKNVFLEILSKIKNLQNDLLIDINKLRITKNSNEEILQKSLIEQKFLEYRDTIKKLENLLENFGIKIDLGIYFLQISGKNANIQFINLQVFNTNKLLNKILELWKNFLGDIFLDVPNNKLFNFENINLQNIDENSFFNKKLKNLENYVNEIKNNFNENNDLLETEKSTLIEILKEFNKINTEIFGLVIQYFLFYQNSNINLNNNIETYKAFLEDFENKIQFYISFNEKQLNYDKIINNKDYYLVSQTKQKNKVYFFFRKKSNMPIETILENLKNSQFNYQSFTIPNVYDENIGTENYWKVWCKNATIINLLPIFWPIGIIIPSPNGIIKIPMPIIWKYLTHIPTPFGTIVIGLTICGTCVFPFIYFFNLGTFLPVLKINFEESGFIVGLRGLKIIKNKTETSGHKEILKKFTKTENNLFNYTFENEKLKKLNLETEDLPTFDRLKIENLRWVNYLRLWCQAGKKTYGWLEN